ncbi:MAG: hypothetical protein GY796_09435 [Chloroflexi bacterium]|nr:hypothetical protein [Chloroflexota bacterium]
MMKNQFVLGSLLIVLVLTACGGGGETAVSPPDTQTELVAEIVDEGGSDTADTGTAAVLTEDYTDALSIQSQLIAGTFNLEGTLLAVDAGLAAELLPLWQAMQTLGRNDTTAKVELTAVLNQIQNTMLPEQIEAIIAMQLTQEDAQAVVQEVGGGFRGGGFGPAGENNNDAGAGGGGFRGGLPGGRPGGGGGPEGIGQLSEDERATRVAERFGSQAGNDVMAQILLGPLIRTLQVRAGVVDESELADGRAPAGFGGILELVADETGLTLEEVRAQLQAGETATDIVAANGGDIAAVQAALQEQFSQNPNLSQEEIETRIDNFLNGVGPDN